MRGKYQIKIYDPYTLFLEWEPIIDKDQNQFIHRLSALLNKYSSTEECVPAYHSLLWILKKRISDLDGIKKRLSMSVDSAMAMEKSAVIAKYSIPVCYEADFAPDLEEVSQHTRLDPEEIIQIHTGVEYHVYMVGFLPGFLFLGGLDPRLHMKRRNKPRSTVPVGSVGIGGEQTGIYPFSSPGGWNLIGNCPLPFFIPSQIPPFLVDANSIIRFTSISAQEYHDLKNREAEFLSFPSKIKKIIAG